MTMSEQEPDEGAPADEAAPAVAAAQTVTAAQGTNGSAAGDGKGQAPVRYRLSGTVRGPDGQGLPEAPVAVWWQHMRSRTELAAGRTGAEGRYELEYEVPPGFPDPLLLLVEAESAKLREPLRSPVTAARPELEVNLWASPPDESEWATLLRAIEPLLDGVKLSEVVEDPEHQDIAFLSREIERNAEVVMRVAVAARLQSAFGIPGAAFYAFLRQRIPASLPSPLLEASSEFTLIAPLIQTVASQIFGLSAEAQTAALTGAVALDYIGPQFTEQISKIVAEMQSRHTSDLLEQPYLVGNTTLGELLGVAGVAEAKQQTFAQVLSANTESMRNFWRKLGEGKSGLSAEEASVIERTLSIGAFVKNHVPLVERLLGDFSSGTYTSLSQLARLSRQEWTALIEETGPPPSVDGAGEASSAEVFASVVYARVTRAYPTAALSSRITTGSFVPEPLREPLNSFFEANPELELLSQSIPAYLSTAGEKAFAGLTSEEQAPVVSFARSFQRILRVAPIPDVAETILGMGLSSATEIASMGEQQFFNRATGAGLTKPEANAAYRAASQRYGTLVSTYMQLNRGALGLWPKAVGDQSALEGPIQKALARDQSLQTLFGDQDYCATDSCTSILSPAAYLCDLLLWLRNRRVGSRSALDVLDSRRPDIRHLLLNCPNSDTEIPYIDLVNEILADAVSPPIDEVSTSYVQSALVDGTEYHYVVTAVNGFGEGPASAEVSATPQAATAVPAAPAGVTASALDSGVRLAWEAVAGASSYNLYWSTSPGVTTASGTKVTGVSDPFTQSGLVNGTAYHYVVTAVNAIGEGPASAEASATPAAATALPGVPADLLAEAGDAEVALSWDTVEGASGYNVYWSTTPGVTTANGTRVTVPAPPFPQSSLVDGTSYHYVVTAVNSLGESPASAEASATPEPATAVPGAPAGLTAVAGDREVKLTWQPVAGASAYNVYWSTSPGVTPANGTAIAGARNPRWKQTSRARTATELRAAPEYFNQGAFVTLSDADYPFTLPYSAGLDELRSYLQNLKLPLWQLRAALIPPVGADTAHRLPAAAERLRLSPHAVDLIAKQNLLEPALAWNVPSPETALVGVESFLQAASITYESLLELLEVTWVQNGAGIAIQGIEDTCSTATQRLVPREGGPGTPLPAEFLDRSHRFLRLWSATGWRMWELDLLLGSPAVGRGQLNEETLTALLAFQQLQDASGLTIDQQLALYQDLDAASHRDPDGSASTSLYAQIFLNTAVTSVAPDPDLDTVAVGGAVAEPALSAHLPGIQAALGVGAQDAELLISLTDGQLTLANLSQIYRVHTLASVARRSLPELLTVAALLSPAAPTPAVALEPLFATPEATRVFLEQASSLAQANISLDAAAYLLRPPAVTTLTASMSETATTIAVASAMGFPTDGFYVTIGAETLLVTAAGGTGGSEWTVARGQLGTTAAEAAAGTEVALVGSWATTTQMTEADIAGALAAVQQAVQAPTGEDIEGTVIAAVAAGAHSAGTAGIANDVTKLVLEGLHVPGSGRTLLETLVDPAFTGSSATLAPAAFPDQFLAIRMFDKLAVLIRALRFVAADLGWLLANAGTYGGLDLTALPVAPSQPALGLQALLSTLLLVKLARLWTAAPPSASVQTLYELIGAVASGTLADAAGAQAALIGLTGWSAEDLAAFAGALGLSFPGSYTEPDAYDALRTLAQMAAATGATGSQLIDWAAVPPDEPTAEGMAAGALGVVKARQPGEEAWLAQAAKLMDPIRERRSAALQAYLIGQRGTTGALLYGDTDALFDHFLIDVQMSSCEETSRVVQAYVAIQIFVERCLLGLEAPEVVVDLEQDDAWGQWQWMSRYRVWEANREVFLYPENWLIESQRPNRTELYRALEQEVQQTASTAESLETVVLNYIERLDGLAHLRVSGTCEDPATGDIHVVARTSADPPTFYIRTFSGGAWGGWQKIQLDIKAHQVVPAMYRGRVCLFWLEARTANEPQQPLQPPLEGSTPPQQVVDRYVVLTLSFSMFSNGSWDPARAANGKLFDKPFYGATAKADARTTEMLYTLKVQAPTPAPGTGAKLLVDVFRLGEFDAVHRKYGIEIFGDPIVSWEVNYISGVDEGVAQHLGRAVFDSKFAELELRDLWVPGAIEQGTSAPNAVELFTHAQQAYGPEAQPLLPLPDSQADPDILSDSGLVPRAGALMSPAAAPAGGSEQTMTLDFTAASGLEQGGGPLLKAAPLPFRVLGPDSDLNFEPTSYFFFQDSRRCYWVQGTKYYWTGSAWAPVAPSDPSSAPYQLRYSFHVFYHAFTGLFWSQLAGGGFPLLYDPDLQQNPDQIDQSGADVFGFESGYRPERPRVEWDHDDVTGQDRQFLDFRPSSANGVYNWELFYHIPRYIGELLSRNQQFEDARTWYQYIFNPTRQGSEAAPQRFWIPKPLHQLTTAEIAQEQINELLAEVNRGNEAAVREVQRWREDPFNPFAIADLRPVAYMKSTAMGYLDNLIGWADNLFASESREALSEATLLYVVASEILGPQPEAIEPPAHADESFDQLEPALDAFANALVEIENSIGGSGAVEGVDGYGSAVPVPQTFYFKIPSNAKLLGYWSTVADRLYKLRHCQSIAGAPLQLALFDAPIDPGLLIAAQAAGTDISSVLSESLAKLPNYRFTALYPQSLDFVNAVRAYGASLQSALERSDAAALTLLQQSQQRQLLSDGSQVLEWQVEQGQHNIAALKQTLALAEQKVSFNSSREYENGNETTARQIREAATGMHEVEAIAYGAAALAYIWPDITGGVAGAGGTPQADAKEGGSNLGNAAKTGAQAFRAIFSTLTLEERGANAQGSYERRQDNWTEAEAEAKIQAEQAEAQIAASEVALQVTERNVSLHQEQIENLEKQIEFVNDKFTSEGLYDWMVDSLAATYFQSYQLAYQMCKQLERCYRFELGVSESSFIQFGYWDSLHKGLLAGEGLAQDLRRLQASYLQQNARRYELSRYVSLGALEPAALQELLVLGSCEFTLPESLFDNDYPGHYNRRLTRVSVTLVYPSPGRFDNVKASLTMLSNKVRVSSEAGGGYAEAPVGTDPRFAYDYAAVPQKIVLGNAQDDPGLFTTAIASNIADQRYLPFENAGAISTWRLEMPGLTNELDLTTVGDVVLHLHYTALEGGAELQQTVEQSNQENRPDGGTKLFSALNDFPAATPTSAEPDPLTPWQAFIAAAVAPADQVLVLNVLLNKFPAWARTRRIAVNSLTLLAVSWEEEEFVLAPLAPLPTAELPMALVPGSTGPRLYSATIHLPANTPIGKWSFHIRQKEAADFRSLTKNAIGDVLMLVEYTVS